MDAAIYIDNGTLIINFANPGHKHLHRNVEIGFSTLGDSIDVSALNTNWIYLVDFWVADFNDCYNLKNIELVQPQYVIEQPVSEKSIWHRTISEFIFSKNRTTKIAANGWNECKLTNIPIAYKTTKFLIIK